MRTSPHVLNLVEIHADTFENFHGLPAEKAMFDAINLRERSFAEEAFHFVGVANYLTLFEQAHKPESTSYPIYLEKSKQQSSKYGWRVLRIWGHELTRKNQALCLGRIRKFFK